MQTSNFTFSEDWIKGIFKRYSELNIKNLSGIYFWEDNNFLKCQHFFDFDISDNSLEMLEKYIDRGISVKFSYLDKSKLFFKLVSWCKKHKYNFRIIDQWKAPRLDLSKSSMTTHEYLSTNSNSQIKRNYKEYLKNKDNYNIVHGTEESVSKLWKDVLLIDSGSWKGQKSCDMQSLNREDLQYIFYLFNNIDNASLSVLYKDSNPLAYSLMFRANIKSMWYAVKWGASDEGRKEKAGFYCLFNHLENIYNNINELNIDFWGRRSQTYDYLKNDEIVRYHVEIDSR